MPAPSWLKRPRTGDTTPGRAPRVLTAAGQRVTSDNAPLLGQLRRGDQQAQAWRFRSTVPEMRAVGMFVAAQASRVHWFAAEDPGEGADPVPLTGELTIDDPADTEKRKSRVSAYTAQVAMEGLARLDLDRRGASMAGRLAENMEYAGECYLLGEIDVDTQQEEWSIRSVSEVRVQQDGATWLESPTAAGTAGKRQLNLPRKDDATGQQVLPYPDLPPAALYRLWVPHPQFHLLADCRAEACIGPLTEIELIDKQSRASIGSRISSGKALFIPDELTVKAPSPPPSDNPDDPAQEDTDNSFISEITEAMMAPITSEDDPSAIVPIVISGPAQGPGDKPMADYIKVIDIPRDDPAEIVAKRDAAVVKVAHGIDFDPERLIGLSNSNHWTGAIIKDAELKNHLEPRFQLYADSLTSAFLRHYCLVNGCPAEEVRWICVWYDASELAQPADPWAMATTAHERNVISDDAYREAGGWTDEDAPSDIEKLYRALSEGRVTPQAVEIMVALVASGSSDPRLLEAKHIAEQMAVPTAQLPGVSSKRQVIDYGHAPTGTTTAPASPALPSTGGPTSPPSAPSSGPNVSVAPRPTVTASVSTPLPIVTASAGDGRDQAGRYSHNGRHYRVDEATCRELGDVDRAIADELSGFIDAAIISMRDRAATRIKNKALRASVAERSYFERTGRNGEDPVPGTAVTIIAAAGPGMEWTLKDVEAFEGQVADIHKKWTTAIKNAAKKIAALIRKLLGKTPTRDVAADIVRRAEAAWPNLAKAIEKTASDVLHGRTDPDDGPILPRSAITAALTEAGGVPVTAGASHPATGLTAGEAVRDALDEDGAPMLAMSWRHWGHPDTPFPAHVNLAGKTFSSWSDPVLRVKAGDEWVGEFYRPGDHPACGCGVSAIFASPLGDIAPDDAAMNAELDALRARYVSKEPVS